MSTAAWPRVAMTLAETHVDWHRVQRHINDRREAVERSGVGISRKIATCIALNGHVRLDDQRILAERLEAALDATARFGFRSAQGEVNRLRGERVTLAYELPDIGSQAEAAAGGIDGVRRLVKRRAREASDRVVTAALASYATSQVGVERSALIVAATRKALHRVVLELVGETLNQGRTAGALAMSTPPEFALRSEQLDKATCDACTRLQGYISQVGSDDYYSNMPPTGCYGGGRCRGIWVFGDSAGQMQQAA